MTDSKTPADPAAYKQLAVDLAAKIAIHRVQAADAGTTNACSTEHTRYDGEVRPMLEHLNSLSGAMDACMKQMGKSADADLASVCGSMMSELDRHQSSACASSDTAANKAEAVRHCDAMKGWLDSQQARATYLSGSMDGMGGGSCK